MKKAFIDLFIRFKDITQEEKILGFEICKEMGYHGIAVEIPETMKSMNDFLFDGLTIWKRTTIIPKSQGTEEIKQRISPLRPRRDIISVLCINPLITKWAANDDRVDLLSFPASDIRKLLDKSTINSIISSEFTKAVEINIAPLIKMPLGRRMNVLRSYSHVLKLVMKKKCPFVIVSGATHPYELRGPRELAAIASLFGLDYYDAIKGLSSIPNEIVRRNISKLEGSIVSPGIEIISSKKEDIRGDSN